MLFLTVLVLNPLCLLLWKLFDQVEEGEREREKEKERESCWWLLFRERKREIGKK